MAKTLSLVSVDTPISGVTTNKIELDLVNFGADFVKKSDSPSEALLTNMRAPVGLPEYFRFATSTSNDIYKGVDINPSYRSQMKQGVSVLVQNIIMLKETDSADPDYEVYYPVKVHTVAVVPNIPTLTAEMADSLIRRSIAGFYQTGDNGVTRVAELLRGKLVPPDVN